jgi:hypothetical protein
VAIDPRKLALDGVSPGATIGDVALEGELVSGVVAVGAIGTIALSPPTGSAVGSGIVVVRRPRPSVTRIAANASGLLPSIDVYPPDGYATGAGSATCRPIMFVVADMPRDSARLRRRWGRAA